VNREPAAVARIIQDFATELTRTPLYQCGHADAWQHVQRADTIEDLLVALGYCEGYADCARLACPWDSPAWRIADTLATAARTLAHLLRATTCVDADGPVTTYRAELADLLTGQRDPRSSAR
jgi:hypothetical protein